MPWVCQSCGTKYDTAGTGFCPQCGDLLVMEADTGIRDTSNDNINPIIPVNGHSGLGILIFDFSGSMTDKAFPNMKNMPQRKIDLVANAFDSAMKRLRNINHADNAYLAVYGFSGSVKLLKIFKASEIDVNKKWDQWILDNFSKFCGSTNITEALKQARKMYDLALKGDLSSYGINNFTPLLHDVTIGNDIISIPNVRVFLYSDGGHTDGSFVNHFNDAYLTGGSGSKVNGLICAYFGGSETSGFRTLLDIAGVCPRHNIKGIIHVNNPRAYPLVREIFHMASSTSGFCAQCAREAQLR